MIPVNLAVEDTLSEAVLRKLLIVSGNQYYVGSCHCEGGFGYLKKIIRGLNHAAEGTPWIILTDLDSRACPLEIILDWLPEPKHHNLLLRVAVREVESWLIGDQNALANFFRIRRVMVPINPESLIDPKAALIALARTSPSRKIREDIAPPHGSISKQGPNYNGRLIEYVDLHWNPLAARRTIVSLDRTINRLSRFSVVWEDTDQAES